MFREIHSYKNPGTDRNLMRWPALKTTTQCLLKNRFLKNPDTSFCHEIIFLIDHNLKRDGSKSEFKRGAVKFETLRTIQGFNENALATGAGMNCANFAIVRILQLCEFCNNDSNMIWIKEQPYAQSRKTLRPTTNFSSSDVTVFPDGIVSGILQSIVDEVILVLCCMTLRVHASYISLLVLDRWCLISVAS